MEDFILRWNNTWQFDYWYRQKYNIPFNSPEHRELCQIDIKMNYLEHHVAEKQLERYRAWKKEEGEYQKTGIWLKKREPVQKVSKELWDAIDLTEL